VLVLDHILGDKLLDALLDLVGLGRVRLDALGCLLVERDVRNRQLAAVVVKKAGRL
jgi:hypothetical protein